MFVVLHSFGGAEADIHSKAMKGAYYKIYNPQTQKWEPNPDWPVEGTPGYIVNDLAANKADQWLGDQPRLACGGDFRGYGKQSCSE